MCDIGKTVRQAEVKPPATGGPGDPDAWVCEQHPDLPFPHGECAGPGMLRRDLLGPGAEDGERPASMPSMIDEGAH